DVREMTVYEAPPRRPRRRPQYGRMAARGVGRVLAVCALAVAVWAVASWAVAPMLGADKHEAHIAAASSSSGVGSAVGGVLPGTAASPAWTPSRRRKTGILDASGASRNAAARGELSRLDLRRGPVRISRHYRTRDLIVYAPGLGRDGQMVA